MIIRKLSDNKPNILLFQGSPRKQDSCANMESKSEKLVKYILSKWSPFANIEVIDLSIGDITIQPCKGCVSSSNGMHCHWKCSCYSLGSETKPDLMYEAFIYDKLEKCDGFMVVSPIHWYSVSSQVKAMFDRLVCANQTITEEQAVEIFGKGNTKNSKLTGRAELSGKYRHLLKNHLEGKWASFLVHGDDGANDYEGQTPPYTNDSMWNIQNSVMPLVYQCRYSGMNCPDDLVESIYINKGMPYYQANKTTSDELLQKADVVFEKLVDYINEKNPSVD
jgi:multimeric flavodoxin WrbA